MKPNECRVHLSQQISCRCQNPFLQQMDSVCCIFAEKGAVFVVCFQRRLGFNLQQIDLIVVLGNETGGFLEYVLQPVVV